MKREEDQIRPRDWLKVIPFQAVAASDRLGWVGLEAALPCVARLGIQRARPYAPQARPCHAAAGRTGTAV